MKQFQTVKEGRAVANVFRQWQNFDFDGSLESFQDWYFEFMFFFWHGLTRPQSMIGKYAAAWCVWHCMAQFE